MDPNETLKNLRSGIDSLEVDVTTGRALDERQILDLVENFRALDGWLRRRGFKPDDWR